MVKRILGRCLVILAMSLISLGVVEKQAVSEEPGSAATSDDGANTEGERDLYITDVASSKAMIGGHEVSAAVTREQPGGLPVGAYDDANGCSFGDTLILRVRRDGTLVNTLTYCSAYETAKVEFKADASGNAFLFLLSAQGHWSLPIRATVTVYSIGEELTQVGDFVVQEPVDNGVAAGWTYEITTPAATGLRIDLKAKTWPTDPQCCKDMEKDYSVTVDARP